MYSCCTDGLVVWHLFFLILCWIYKTLKTLKMSGISNIMCYVINHANIWIHFDLLYRGGSRGRVQGGATPLPQDDLRFSNTTGILQKNKKLCGLLVLK